MKIKIVKIKKFFRELFLFMVEHDFLTCLIFVFLSLVLGGLLFYKYGILTKKIEPEFSEQQFLIKEKVYQEVSDIWQEQEKRFKGADFKEYTDPFKERVSAPEEPKEEEFE